MLQSKLTKSRILVSGACGSVGSAIVKRLIADGHLVCAFDNSEDGLFELEQSIQSHKDNLRLFLGDIRDKNRVRQALERVNIVFHCAALKHVYISEYNPFEAIQTNVIGTNNVVECAIDAKVSKVVFTSSDKAVNPTSAMGASKLLAERLILAANGNVGINATRFSAVRFGNVLNSNGSVLKIFNAQIENGERLTITSTEMTRFFLTMQQAVNLCIEAACNMSGGEIFIKNMGSCDILTLAKAFLGKNNEIKFDEIGAKPGEKKFEELVTNVESIRTILFKDTYVILPELSALWPEPIRDGLKKYYKHETINEPLRSDTVQMSVEDVEQLIRAASLN